MPAQYDLQPHPPRSSAGATHDRQNIRLFLISHRYGPFIGLALAAFLLLLGFPFDDRLLVFAGLVCLFWPYGLAVGRVPYVPLCLCSLQHLCFVIMWASHGYGGLASPFMLWLAVVPLLAFLYLSPNVRLWMLLIAMIAGNLAGLALVSQLSPPPPVDRHALHWMALVSCVCAAAYVSMMAVHFGRLLNSREAVEKEAARHRDTVASLQRLDRELRQMAAAKSEMIDRIGREAQAPLAEIEAVSAALRQAGDGVAAADLRSIAEVVRYLAELVQDIQRFGQFGGTRPPNAAAPCELETLLAEVAARAKAWPKCPPILIDRTAAVLVAADCKLLEEAILQLLRHLGQPAFNRPLTLRGSCLPSEGGDYVVIDVMREPGRDAPSPENRPAGSYGSTFSLALAKRILSVLGATLNRDPGRSDGSHLRVEIPPAMPA